MYKSGLVPDAILLALTPNKATLAAKVVSNNRVRQGFMSVVQELTRGSTRILISSREGTKMEIIGSGHSLYGLTAIFPWAIDLLSRRPNCLMMDGTFNCCRPYVMIVLHAIFANESIPFAFGLSPSETTDAYVRLYHHLSEFLEQFPKSMRESLPSSIETHDVVFAEGQLPHPIDPNDEEVGDIAEPDPFEDGPHVTEAALHPMLSVDDQEARDELMPEPGRHTEVWDFLSSIPLVTDQGTALRSFVRRFGLKWKLCHRHIIESVGAYGPIGLWVSQILRCYSIEDYETVREMVLLQMATLDGQFPKAGPAFDTLQRLLGILHDDHPLSDMCTWALWERRGCPRTTNSIESVHGHLNFDVRGRNAFVERLILVIRHLLRRYERRNEWRDRSLHRHADDCFPSEEERTRLDWNEARWRYFVAMHNAFDLTQPVRREFPSGDLVRMIPPSSKLEETDAVLPRSWVRPTIGSVISVDAALIPGDRVSFMLFGTTHVVAHCIYSGQLPNGTLSLLCPTQQTFYNIPRNLVTFEGHADIIPEDRSTILPLHRAPNMGKRETMTWDLAWRYHRQYGQDFWAEHGVNIFTKFVELSEELKPEGFT
jgi:hypothetical protein